MIQVHDLRRVPADVAEAWADHIADHLRDSDVEEVAASSGLSPHSALHTSLALSTHAYCIESDRVGPVALFGAAPHPLPEVGIAWMLGTDGIRLEARHIARHTRRYLDELNAAYPILWNYIDARNELSMRWLRWGGFELLGDHRVGPEGLLFHTFARTQFHV